MTGAEMYGLILLSIVVIFFAAGVVFIAVDVYKERRKKRSIDEKIADNRIIGIEGMIGDTKDKVNALIDMIRTFAMREGEADAKIIEEVNEIKRRQMRLFESVNCIHTFTPYTPTEPTGKEQSSEDDRVVSPEEYQQELQDVAAMLEEMKKKGAPLTPYIIVITLLGRGWRWENPLHNDTK